MADIQMDSVIYGIEVYYYDANKIKTKTYEKNNVSYNILNYDNTILCSDDYYSSFYRSVIVANPENRILCFAPDKSVENFREEYDDKSIIANDIVEGTMINLFYDYRIQKWELSTRGAIGANYFYYRNQYAVDSDKTKKQPTFYQMFLDALRAFEGQTLNDIVLLNEFSKNCCYSFVLQHPDNHIVLNIETPTVYLVGVYEIIDENRVKYIPSTEYEKWDFLQNAQVIQFPKSHRFTGIENMKEIHCSIQQPYTHLGIMFTNSETGERIVAKNPNYEEIKVLRGNNPNLQYQYLCLRRMGKVMDFVKYFPQYKKLFYNFYTDFNNFVTNVHCSYVTYYIQKQEVEISKKYFPHIYKIHHSVYLPSLQTENPMIIRRKIVQDYFDAMAPREVLYHLNYDVRLYFREKNEDPVE